MTRALVPDILPRLLRHLCIDIRIKSRQSGTSGILQTVAKLGIKLWAHATAPGGEHLIAKTDAGPRVPTNERTSIKVSKGVFRVCNIIAVCKAEAVRCSTVLVVNELGTSAISRERIAGMLVFSMARRGDSHDLVALCKHDATGVSISSLMRKSGFHLHIFPVMAMPPEKGTQNGLVLFEIIFIHDCAVSIVATLSRVCIAVF